MERLDGKALERLDPPSKLIRQALSVQQEFSIVLRKGKAQSNRS
jgi:hypothetical protein